MTGLLETESDWDNVLIESFWDNESALTVESVLETKSESAGTCATIPVLSNNNISMEKRNGFT